MQYIMYIRSVAIHARRQTVAAAVAAAKTCGQIYMYTYIRRQTDRVLSRDLLGAKLPTNLETSL